MLLRVAAVFLTTFALALPAFAQKPTRTVVFESDGWLVMENHYPPGSVSDRHTHHWPRTIYVLEGGTVELTGADGASRTVELATGQTLQRPPETHVVRNVGNNPVRVLETEVRPSGHLPTYAFSGGLWFDGETFVERELYSVNGMFTDQAPERIDEIVDLSGHYLLPPFGDAHAHHFDSPPIFSTINQNYVREGIFYGISLTNTISGKNAVRPMVRRPETIDVAYADAGITATQGHPVMVYETLARGSYDFDKTKVEWGLDPQAKEDAYFLVDTQEDLERQWNRILASRPDLLKIYLLLSEDYEKRKDKADTYGDRGLNPDLVPRIMELARESGIRVSAHVETAHDYRVAVQAGVDIIGHLPGYSPDKKIPMERYRLTEADATLAAEKGTVVIPTPLGSAAQRYGESDPEFLKKVHELHHDNISLLAKAGVPLAIGTDAYFVSSSKDAFLLKELGIFSNLEMLRMWCVTTPLLAFPRRAIARLEPGHEASFIGLTANPLEDFNAVKGVAYRFKQGRPLTDETPTGK